MVVRALGAPVLQAIEVRDGAGRTSTIQCDALAMSGGWSPTVHLTSHLGGKPVWNDAIAAFAPGSPPPE